MNKGTLSFYHSLLVILPTLCGKLILILVFISDYHQHQDHIAQPIKVPVSAYQKLPNPFPLILYA